jgi:hypothetical protein
VLPAAGRVLPRPLGHLLPPHLSGARPGAQGPCHTITIKAMYVLTSTLNISEMTNVYIDMTCMYNVYAANVFNRIYTTLYNIVYMPAVCCLGLSVIFSPLISLVHDHVRNTCRYVGIPRVRCQLNTLCHTIAPMDCANCATRGAQEGLAQSAQLLSTSQCGMLVGLLNTPPAPSAQQIAAQILFMSNFKLKLPLAHHSVLY